MSEALAQVNRRRVAAALTSGKPRLPRSDTMRGMARILHIEDDPANRLLVRKLLQKAGHEVIDAADGLAGVRLACSVCPDLVLVDLNIPGLDGYEVTLR